MRSLFARTAAMAVVLALASLGPAVASDQFDPVPTLMNADSVVIDAPATVAADTVDAFVTSLLGLDYPVLHSAMVTFPLPSYPAEAPARGPRSTGVGEATSPLHRYERPPNRIDLNRLA
jgi:hypothetical protein